MINKFFLLLSLFFLTQSCEKIEYAIDNPFSRLPTKVLMHRGNGNNTNYTHNTLQAANYGFSVLDGVELDIQISKEGTLWLDHDNEVHDCEGNVIGCFQELSDAEIVNASICADTLRYHTLESVFKLMTTTYPDSYLSIDAKSQYCEIINTAETMRDMGQSILKLVIEYNLEGKIMVESSSIFLMDELDNQQTVAQFSVSLGDIDKGIADAAATKSRGISLKYGVEEIDLAVVNLIHRKGYALIVWVVNEPDDINAVWHTAPEFIQTDRADFREHILPGIN